MARPSGFKGFLLIWSSQVLSILASSMTGFGLSLWMFERTRSATAMAIVQICFITPFLLFSPLAGVFVDRYSRKLMMAVSDLVAVAGTVSILLLNAFGALRPWHLYATAVLGGLGNCFQWPAYSAAITVMMPKEQYARANALSGIMEAGPDVLAPLLAAALLPLIGLDGIMAIDVATFGIALGSLALVAIPPHAPKEEGVKRSPILKDAIFGFKYIFQRKALLALLIVFLASNLFSGFSNTLRAPMVLGLTGMNKWVLGAVQTAFAVGGVGGGLVVGAWGGFKNRVAGVLVGIFGIGAAGCVAFSLSTSLYVWIGCGIVVGVSGALANASSQAIWQSKVPPELQGRVFSARRMIAWITGPLVPALAGPLADYVFEPMMRSGAAPAFLASLFGARQGSGTALLIGASGLVATIVPFVGWASRTVRRVDEAIPDREAASEASSDGAPAPDQSIPL
jgi:DHA3 family macrolide efflux protein-like MFS transporter